MIINKNTVNLQILSFLIICFWSVASSGYKTAMRLAAVAHSSVNESFGAPRAETPELTGVISAMALCSGSSTSTGCLFYILSHRVTSSYCLPCYSAV